MVKMYFPQLSFKPQKNMEEQATLFPLGANSKLVFKFTDQNIVT